MIIVHNCIFHCFLFSLSVYWSVCISYSKQTHRKIEEKTPWKKLYRFFSSCFISISLSVSLVGIHLLLAEYVSWCFVRLPKHRMMIINAKRAFSLHIHISQFYHLQFKILYPVEWVWVCVKYTFWYDVHMKCFSSQVAWPNQGLKMCSFFEMRPTDWLAGWLLLAKCWRRGMLFEWMINWKTIQLKMVLNHSTIPDFVVIVSNTRDL